MDQRRHSLLVVDDEVDVLESLRHLFHRTYRVLTASNGAQALEILGRQEVHLILSDQRMPGMTGDEFLVNARKLQPDAIRMLFTGFADLESIIAAINQGHIFQFLKKPWQPEGLLAAVRQAALEYDNLETLAMEREQLLDDVSELKNRVSALESEVHKLRSH
jgi:response regulator RpfG family c-di-GMP phosphodiesterase